MAEKSGFFASVAGDRQYDMAFLATWISSIIGNGVYSGNLAVAAGSAMTITIPAGQAWINGYYYNNGSTLTLTVGAADGVLNRKDTVVLRWDVNTRSITAQVLKGTAASSPTAPALVRGAEQYDLKLAEISIPAGTTAITGGLITDTRLITSVCGIVTGVVSQVDATTLYNQIQGDLATFKSTSEAGFTTWFNTIKGQLSTDAAGNLQAQITNLPATATPLMDGTAAIGTSAKLAKEDHRHASDTTRAPLASPTFTGSVTIPQLAASLNCLAHTIYFTEYDNGNSGTSKVINRNLSNHQKVTLTSNCTFTFTAPPGACHLQLTMINDATAGRTRTLPSIGWLNGIPTWVTTANARNVLNLYYNGTDYIGMAGCGWTWA